MKNIEWENEREISKEEFCKKIRTPKNWHMFEKDLKLYECELQGRTYQRCETKDDEMVFTKVDNEIWVKVKAKDQEYWSEWHDWIY